MRHFSRKKPGTIATRQSAQTPLYRHAADHANQSPLMSEPPGLLSPAGITALQRSIGNQGVQRMLRDSEAASAQTAPANVALATIHRKPVRVPRGASTSSSWKFIRTEGDYDIYDDGLPESDIDKLAPSRWAIEDFQDPLSDAELSDSEIDLRAKSGKKKVYRVRDIRDAQKVVENIMRKNPKTSIAVRTEGSNTVFRLEGRGTQFFVKVVARGALKQSDGSVASGAMPPRAKDDPKPTGKRASYEHVVSELRDYDSAEVAQAIYDKYFNRKPYPVTFSDRAMAKMDELFVLLSIAEPFRARYALALLVAAIKALQNGESMEDVLYKGKGQLGALHVGASSHKDSRVSGQLMEQNMGRGRNDPHPTQSSMSISDTHFKGGAKRTRDLFTKAASGQPFEQFLSESLIKPMQSQKKTKMASGPTTTVTPLSAMGQGSGLPPLPSLTPPVSGMPPAYASGWLLPPPLPSPPPFALSSLPSLSSGSMFSPTPVPSLSSGSMSLPPLPALPPLPSLLSSFSPMGVVPPFLPAQSSPVSGLPPSSSPVSVASPSPMLTPPLPSLLSSPAPLSVASPPPMPSMSVPAIDSVVQSEQRPRGNWNADIVVTLASGAALSVADQVQYKGVTYTVKSITPTGLVLLKR